MVKGMKAGKEKEIEVQEINKEKIQQWEKIQVEMHFLVKCNGSRIVIKFYTKGYLT